jgi:hypothetical protein
MACPDWSRLAALRALGDTAPEGWALALEHFDGCLSCRPAALKADPLLVFRRLPVAELTPAAERSEVESVRQAVAAMRTASRLESRRRFGGWHRWAAAAGLAFVSLAVGRGRSPQLTPSPTPVTAAAPAVRPAPFRQQATAGDSLAIEGLNRPQARVYYLDDQDNQDSGNKLRVAWVVDESLEI